MAHSGKDAIDTAFGLNWRGGPFQFSEKSMHEHVALISFGVSIVLVMVIMFTFQEFVDPLYLVKQERNVADEITVRYGWGIRAQLEVDKYMVLKFVAGVRTNGMK